MVVCTPPSTHFELAAAVLAAGKPLLLEKPMTGTLAEAEQLADLDAARRAPAHGRPGLALESRHPARCGSCGPRLGRVHLVRGAQRLAPTTLSWQRNLAETVGGSVLLTGVHLFDTVRFVTGAEFVSVDSRQAQIQNPVVEDLFLARAVLADGCWVSLEVSKYTQSRACWLEVVGEEGQIQADYLEGGIVLRTRSGQEKFDDFRRGPHPAAPACGLAGRRSDRNTPPPVTVADGLATLQVVDACYRSHKADSEVPV